MGLTTMIKNYLIFILALAMFMKHDGASRTREYSFANLVYSPSLPQYKDLIGGDGGGPSSAAADGGVPPPPPPYCLYPPPPNPALPSPLPPEASPPGEPPQDSSPSIAPASVIINPPVASPPTAGSPPPSTAPGISSPPQPAFMPPVAFPTPPPPGQAARRPGMWCVANPKAASAAVMQTAMDYACGSGADCGMAGPGGPCYLPDMLTAHASFAFNSYWQRTKDAGGTCDFAGAAMVVTRDPSYGGCRYVSI